MSTFLAHAFPLRLDSCRAVSLGLPWLVAGFLLGFADASAQAALARTSKAAPGAFIQNYCLDCHDADAKKGGLNLESWIHQPISEYTTAWEKVVRKLNTRQMPPPGKGRPSEAEYRKALTSIESKLDRHAALHPEPGRTETFRRLTRTEYQHAIQDLLALEIDASSLLPKEDSSRGFDNVTVANLSPTLLNRYFAAAEKISRLAVGAPSPSIEAEIYRIRPDLTQEGHVEGMPWGTRGGVRLSHHAPQSGTYEIQVRLARDRNEEVEGLYEPHQLLLLLDKKTIGQATVSPPPGRRDFSKVDAHLHFKVNLPAGAQQIGVTFLQNTPQLAQTRRQPWEARFNMHRHPRLTPAIYEITIQGPFHPSPPSMTPSRRILFGDLNRATNPGTNEAARILSQLMLRAYRRPPDAVDLSRSLAHFESGRALGGFESGIEHALASILANPNFLFRVERDPTDLPSGQPYRITSLELASRLSFFLWSSLPDDTLLELARNNQLQQPAILRQQVRRMLADAKVSRLSANFAGQWLQLPNLDSVSPDQRLFPDFDDNLRQALKTETRLFFESVLRENRGAIDLLTADYTYLNERLARHYGIAHVQGSHFRRVQLGPDRQRGGLLRHGSVLTVTSYATRTSPVLRGQWVLENILGTPAPPPPENVPSLDEKTTLESLPMRERLAQHRANPACSGCHNLMDPPGFALGQFDAVGRWRTTEDGQPIDVSGGLPDGSVIAGVAGLEQRLQMRPDIFAATLTEKLLTFALGRGVEPSDSPAVRKIVREAAKSGYRVSDLILGVVQSTPFNMRSKP
ncbi:MAG: DUF1592 domain-containing protein [Verrucomicrobia bacterium]|nr:DUF1592 domain-containing protein [Verrucomicrobiota bacterium]